LDYLQVLNSEELMTAAIISRRLTQKLVERLDILHANGAIQPSAFYDLRAQLASDELNVVNSQVSVKNAKIGLVQLMNIDYDTSMQLEKKNENILPEPYIATREAVFQKASENLSFIKAAKQRMKSASLSVKAAHGARLPTLSLNGFLGRKISSAASTLDAIGNADVATGQYVFIDGMKNDVLQNTTLFKNKNINYFNQWKNNFNTPINISLQIPLLNGLQLKNQLTRTQLIIEICIKLLFTKVSFD
jgi:outer membrane protein